jgi:molybdopterin adenylyltransferase
MSEAVISSIVYKPETAQPADHFLRVPLTSAELVTGHGIEGDRKGGNPKRQLNIMSRETIQELEREGYTVAPGALGEQIIIDGLDVRDLPIGSWLQIGSEAQIEVISLRNGCDRFEHIQGKPKASGRIGVMAGVVHGGSIAIGDSVKVIQPEQVVDVE